MELEILKKSWEDMNKRLETAEVVNAKLVETIMSSRVMTTVEKLRRLYNSFFVVLGLEIIFLIAILVGNPFDFSYRAQYFPYGLLLICVIVALVNLIQLTRVVNRLSPALRIDHYLSSVIAAYDRNKKFERWFGIMSLGIGLVIPFSFLPKKIERLGLAGAMGDTAIMVVVTLIIYVIAFKLGAFNNPHKAKLEKDLAEWNELKSLAGNLKGT